MGSCVLSWWIVVDSLEAGDGTKATIATNERMSNCATLSSWIKDKAMTPSLVDSQVWKLVVRLWDAFIVSWLNIIGWESRRPCCLTGHTFHHKKSPTFKDNWRWVTGSQNSYISAFFSTQKMMYYHNQISLLSLDTIITACILRMPISFNGCHTFLFL